VAFSLIEREAGRTTIVNTEQITYIREDSYGVTIHFSSGEHVVCPMELDTLTERLFGAQTPEQLLIQPA